ncbi:LpqB family beta-propeller domain-containing protein [Streptomyces millisiae]|uniref:LpqB family beta-propeller domain-containing protein n=1 Tax=Streptomyces millisiae TaxID=3075542 RepID=A0ABU2M0Y2_9ACTN|nr:LpqB family beta-propeller domain-containing protein [Streptomyces sp. DSM 44918]MDT0323223.1 LpqB family beta-propeller domain-containing protein [Streptomyces sp. DSM 44918]
MRSERRPRWRVAAGLAAVGLVLSGCASMPSSGPVQRVDASERADSDGEGEPQVRVYGVPPAEGALPQAIVRGFLEAITSDEADFETAREYLTPRRRGEWDPFASTTILSSGADLRIPGAEEPAASGDGQTMRVELTGSRLATVDEAHVYSPEAGEYQATFLLRRVDDQWRIDTLPDGLVIGEADFRRIYRSVNTFYYADLGPEGRRIEHGEDVLVADPVYVRRRIDPVGETVRTLLEGPSEWLSPAVASAFPSGAEVADDHAPAIDESGAISVWLSGVPVDWPVDSCERMAAQLLHTVQDVASVDVTEARLLDAVGTPLCDESEAAAREHAPGLLAGELTRPYFLEEDGDLVQVVEGEEQPSLRPVPGTLDEAEGGLRAVAIRRDGEQAAGVSADGSTLYVAPLTNEDDTGPEVHATSATGGDDAGLSAPSWDGLGDLWVADRDPAGPRLLRLTEGRGTPVEVPVEGLRHDQRIEALRVASDGVRIAMLIGEADGGATLHLGRIERVAHGEGGEGTELSVTGLRPVMPQLEDVAAVSWAGGSRLVVVGRPADGVEQLMYVRSDGSTVNTPTVPGLNDVTGVAATENEDLPLLAETVAGVAWLQDRSQWKVVGSLGRAPVYAG